MIPFDYFFYIIALEFTLVSWDGTMKILARWGMLGEQEGARAYYLWHGQVALHYTWQRKTYDRFNQYLHKYEKGRFLNSAEQLPTNHT